MKRRYAVLLGVGLGLVGAIVGFATVARSAGEVVGPPIGPVMQRDRGAGEVLLAVVGGVYASREEAEAANSAMEFGDVQGYYVVPADQFGGLAEQIGASPGGYALVSVFRTDAGARSFVDFARARQQPAWLISQRVQSFGGAYAGLGQERNLQGTGPLTNPVPASLAGADAGA
jgi:hypothetical protein